MILFTKNPETQLLLGTVFDNNNLKSKKIKNYLKKNNIESCIYLFYLNNNPLKRYVGSSLNISKRFDTHIYNHINSKFSRAIEKYGWNNISFKILKIVEPDLLLKEEQYFLDLLSGNKITWEKCWNLSTEANSNKGFKHSEETKKFLSEISLNKPRNEITKRKISNSLGKTTSLYDKDNNLIKSYNSIRGLEKDLKTKHHTIKKYINNNLLFRDMYLIKVNDYDNNTLISFNKIHKSLTQTPNRRIRYESFRLFGGIRLTNWVTKIDIKGYYPCNFFIFRKALSNVRDRLFLTNS